MLVIVLKVIERFWLTLVLADTGTSFGSNQETGADLHS